ncbi:uncharacterized protein LOC126814816 [Patella vulgata]|uniref:uncharacterized protein LOC126814816 n=1 Tax=Patella vulgata TaxID=6465 RepID=UPI00218032E2|nr:uncharacterized protein LOC126814816 [Patella vulgata]
MPRSKKQSKAGLVGKKDDLDSSKNEGHWVHVEGAEQLHQDSWEIVEDDSSLDVVPQEDSSGIIDPKDDEIVDILTDNLAGGLLPSSESMDFPQEMEKSSDFQIIEMKDPKMLDEEEEETSFIDTDEILESKICQGELVKTTPDLQSLEFSQLVKQDSSDSQSSNPPVEQVVEAGAQESLTAEEMTAKNKGDGKKSKGKKKKEKKVANQPNIDEQLPEPSVALQQVEAEIVQSEGSSSGDNQEVISEPAVAADKYPVDAADVKGSTSGNISSTKPKKQKGKKNKSAATSLPGKAKDSLKEEEKNTSVEEQKQKKEQERLESLLKKEAEKFVTYSKEKQARDLSTLSVLLAKDETIDSLSANSEDLPAEVQEEPAELQPEPIVSETPGLKLDRRSSDRESSVSVDDLADVDDAASTQESNGSPKLSKSAKRRKKQKAKMAKAIETFSNPALLMEKYEKSFGEPYESPEIGSGDSPLPVIDNLTCPICLEVYHRPHLVQPCGHIFCEPCLRRLTTRTCAEVPCPMCRIIIISCTPDDELSSRVSLTYPDRVAARNRAERKSKSKRNPLPRVEHQPLSHDLINQMVTTTSRSRSALQRTQLPFNRSHIQKLLLVIICVISYIFTSVTIRAISSFLINSNEDTTGNFFVLIVFCLYFYFIDKGMKFLLALYDG